MDEAQQRRQKCTEIRRDFSWNGQMNSTKINNVSTLPVALAYLFTTNDDGSSDSIYTEYINHFL